MPKINPRAAAWSNDYADPVFWSVAFFSGKRYGHYTSSILESANAWLRAAREKPLIEMLEYNRVKLMGMFEIRREEGAAANIDTERNRIVNV